jgi:hypothetical protein
VGNEVTYVAGVGLDNAIRLNDEFTEAMLKVDPTIRTVVSTGNAEDWDEVFLATAKQVDMCAQHNYIRDNIPNWEPEQLLSAAEEILYPLLKRQNIRSGGKPVLLDEWNMHWGWWGDGISGMYAATALTMLIRRAEELNLYGASYFALVNEGCIRVYTDHVTFAPDGEVLMRMANHAGGEVVVSDDPAWVKTEHEDFDYISVYNPSVTENKVLTDFINTGVYDIRRDFFVTNSPSMDILISSNLERLLYLLSGRDGEAVKEWMNQLEEERIYEVSDAVKEGMKRFHGGFCSEEETEKAVGDMYRNHNYLMDTHTAVAYKVYQDYVKATGDETPTLIASTASPYKFAESVGRSIGLTEAEDGFAAVRALNEKTGVYVQKGLKDLDQKPVIHTGVCEVGGQAEVVLEVLR